ncbi:MAG: aldose 1-epimerase [Lutibacter sp.]|nr:aldose 1-epimerase [Lutibacter sp.]MDP3944517.1 aldose 1-epimerase [Lutibacter sp.]
MYQIKQTIDLKNNINFIEIEDSNKATYAKIHLNLGGSLQELMLLNHHLIKDLHPLTYQNTYASAILFPFANRIADGSYVYDNKTYQLEINQKEENNALHGLIYNKTFELISQKTTPEKAEVLLSYEEFEQFEGFPFTYAIDLKYILTKNSLDVIVSIKNTDTKTFPFTIGWHPYFISQNLFKSAVHFKSRKKFIFDKRNITQGIEEIAIDRTIFIENKTLDDCFDLDSNEISFETPVYSFALKSSEKDSFLQLYTPPHPNTIAIEPTTGISNSFNNGEGLKTLNPNDSYQIQWNLKLI